LHEGDWITIDGGTGFVYEGIIPTIEPMFSDELRTLLSWADEIATMKVFANADYTGRCEKSNELWCNGNWTLQNRANV
jgi:pyruvate,orthophosphate dikinase